MTIKADPGGFPQRKLSEVPSVTGAQMREIQRAAQEDFGLDILQITENGGRAAAMLALAMLGGRGRGQRIVVLAGGGNKGATGLCAARHLVNYGFLVEPVLGEMETELSFFARRQWLVLKEAGIVEPHDLETSEITVEEHLSRADLVIDALVGYGLEGPPMGITAAVTELAVQSRRPILALDLPTGVNSTTGDVSSPAVRAITTLAMDLPKVGTLHVQCKSFVGEMFLCDLGLPRRVHEQLGFNVGSVFSEGPIVRLRR